MSKDTKKVATGDFFFEKAPPVMDSFALSVVKNGANWQLIEIPYNLETMTTGTPKVISENDSMLEIEYQFKINAADRMFS